MVPGIPALGAGEPVPTGAGTVELAYGVATGTEGTGTAVVGTSGTEGTEGVPAGTVSTG